MSDTRHRDCCPVRISVKSVLDFFDAKLDNAHAHTTQMISLIGEDLAAGVFKHFLEQEQGCEVDIFLEEPREDWHFSGRRRKLDRWILVEQKKTLYQVEIKGGTSTTADNPLPIQASEQQLALFAKRELESQAKQLEDPQDDVNKVLMRTRDPSFEVKPEWMRTPLIIHWSYVHAVGKSDSPFFEYTLDGGRCDGVGGNVPLSGFSVSLYMRKLLNSGFHSLVLEMPEVKERLSWLQRIIPDLGG